jgi:hypothetical protein
MHDKQQWIATLLSIGILLLVLTLRMRKMNKARPLRVERLWILPAFYGAVVIALFWVHPPRGIVWAVVAVALAIGLGLGWYRGKLMHIAVDPTTREVSQQGTTAAMIFILLLVGLRYAARAYGAAFGGNDPAAVVAATDLLLALGLGFVVAQRIEMGLRARRLIAAAKGDEP